MPDLRTVRRIATGLPEVEEVPGDRIGWRVRGKLFAWQARERDGGGLAVRVDREEKELILGSDSDAYFTSPHYAGYPAVQIHLDRIGRDELAERIEEAWLIQAPKRLAAAYLERRQPSSPGRDDHVGRRRRKAAKSARS